MWFPTEFRSQVWQSDSFTDSIIIWLPWIDKALQAAAFFNPPDAQGVHRIGGFYDAAEEAEVIWQVNFAILPKFHEWFDFEPKKEREDPWRAEVIADFRKKYIEVRDDSLEYYEQKQQHYKHFVLPGIITLALVAPANPHAHLALRILQEDSWGPVVNAASTLGLLYLGETDVKLGSLHHIIGKAPNPFEPKPLDDDSKPGAYNELKVFREFEPRKIPQYIWDRVLKTLEEVLTESDPILGSLLRLAQDTDSKPLTRSIYLLSINVGYYNLNLHRAVLDSFWGMKDRSTIRSLTTSWRRLLESTSDLEETAEIRRIIEDAIERLNRYR